MILIVVPEVGSRSLRAWPPFQMGAMSPGAFLNDKLVPLGVIILSNHVRGYQSENANCFRIQVFPPVSLRSAKYGNF